MESKSSKNRPFFILILPGILICAFTILYFPVGKQLIKSWAESEQNSHGFLIIPICFYIFWIKWNDLKKIPILPSIWGLVIVVFSLLLYIFSKYAAILTLTSFSLVPLIIGTVIYLYGFKIFKHLSFPLFFLFFMIPVPAQIYAALTIHLQLFISEISSGIAALFGIPVYRNGNIIHLPDRILQVVQACSGMRSMISLLALSAVFGYLSLKSTFLRTILFLFGIPVAILVNIIRVFLTIIFFHYFKFDLTQGSVHTFFGILIFIFAFIFLAAIRGILFKWDKTSKQN